METRTGHRTWGKGFLCLPVLLPGFLQEPAAPDPVLESFRKEEAEELDRTKKELAKKHYKLAKWCEKSKLPRRARFHYLRAISYIPDHEGARKVLGYKRMGTVWAAPREAVFRVAEDERIAPPEGDEDVTAEWKTFQTQYQPILQLRAEHDLRLADKAKKAGLSAEEERILRRIAEYWPDCVDARNRLKDLNEEVNVFPGANWKGKPIWFREVNWRIFDAIKVEGPLKGPTEEEQKVKLPLAVFRTEHFRLAGVVGEEFVEAYVRAAEAGFRGILALNPAIPLPQSAGKWPIRGYTFLDEADYQTAVGAILRTSPKELQRISSAGAHRDPLRFFIRHPDLGARLIDTERMIHFGAEYAMETLFPHIPPWLQEALAYTMTQNFNGSCHTTCLASERGSQVDTEDRWRQPNAWRDLLVESVLLREDPPAKEIFAATFNKLRSRGGVKAWSLVQFLRARDAQLFGAVLKDAASKLDPAVSVERLYKLDARLLDQEWREWVLQNY